MGATPSVQRDATSPEDAPEDAVIAEVNDTRDGENVDDKTLQKNGQISISSLNGKTEDQSEYNGHTEDNPPAEVGQTESISQKEDCADTIEVHPEEAAPQVNGEKGDDSANADEITTTEEKTVEEKQEEANEVGFKKIFRFVGFKFTLKKDKSEKTEPVQLLTVKEAEDGAQDASSEENKEEPTTEEATTEEAISVVEKSPAATEKEQEKTDVDVTDKVEETTEEPEADVPEAKKNGDEVPEKSAEEEEAKSDKEPEPEVQTESSTSPLSQETQSPFRRFFTHGIFSNLRKKTSFKKSKDEEQVKEKSVEEDIKETEEKPEGAIDSTEKVEVDAEKGPAEAEQIGKPTETEAETKDDTAEVQSGDIEEHKDLKVEAEPASETVAQTETAEAPAAETADDAHPTEDAEPTNDKPDVSEEVITEAEILSSQEKAKPQGSPLKKLFTGAGLKKLSSKKQKSKKEAESKQAESGEQAVEQIQSPETQKPDSGASSPEESVEHVVGEVRQAEAAQAMEPEGEPVTSDSEKKKEGILPWSSFKKLVTPKKRVKRPSESEDEATTDKPKSSTLSSTESANAVTDEKNDEPKPSEEVAPEPEEETQAESNVEEKPEMTEQVPDEPRRKMDTSVSWEALICVGSSKKRARKTSDSDDEEPKNEEEVQQSGEEQAKITESPIVSSGEADHENLASSPEPEEELVSTWESFKRLVTHRKKTKSEDKSDEASAPEQTTSDSEIPKEESSFSLKKLIPRRKKKSGKQKQASSDVGSAEDDSDTPAVVPLSEYENDTSAEVAEKPEEVKQETAPVTQVKDSTEDRSPSWISTAVENLEDEADVKQLSDIPEEADTAATPKSPDNTIAEDIVELTSEAVTCLEQVEETEMVSAVSRVTASPVTSGETTPVPGDSVETKTDVVLQEAVETITVTTCAITVTATEEQKKNAVVITDALPIESATKEEKTVLVAHKKTEATALCTGLHTKEIGVVKEESISKTSVESVTVVSQAVVTEISVEDTTEKLEKATAAKEEVYEAEVSEVKPDLKDALLENAVEEKVQFEEVKETPEAETVTDLQEVAAVKLAVMTAVQQEPEVLEEPVVAEQLPKVEAEGPVEPTVEESICAKTAEVTVVAIAKDEKMQVLEDVEESAAKIEVAPIEEVSVAVTEEVMAILPDVPTAEIAKSQDASIPIVAPAEDFAVIKETVCVLSSTSETTETHTAVLGHEATMQKVPLVVPTGDHNIQVIVNDVDAVSAQEVIESNIEVASTKVTVVVEETCEAVLEDAEAMQANQVIEAEIIVKQSSVIVQEIIQNVVENFVETHEDETSVEKVESLETTPEKPNTSETTTKDDDKQTRIVIEKPTKTNKEAVEVAETRPVSLAGEIPVEKEEVAAVSVTDVQQETEVTKSEVELKQVEKKTDTESEDGKGQVEATETSVEEKLLSAETPAKVEITSEQCQVVKEVPIESTQEFNVGVVYTINAVDEHVQDTNKTEDKSKGQESAEDMLHKDLEEPQTQDTKKQEESRNEDAKNVVAKQEIAAEKTTNAIVVEELENDIESVSTEVATVS
ncbi:A-kinase anchor protein 12b isoform X1 [Triplophysa dalaica]|uniref:A-kinase anchor protein 12b isoform X1 n=1 Tax=Triplophysa dalaica TaxID=1582913 RepID=UPI0024DF9336|nr:A-kinase anchor protein 12b isoform X1 [Triplophysa dalaica]